jgi:site-specific recombinase XerC
VRPLIAHWIAGIGLDPHVFGTHSLRRTKATLIYRSTGNLRAVQPLLGIRGNREQTSIRSQSALPVGTHQ